MKKNCEIVQDLLFGYSDNTLNNASKELVEEHLKKCSECKKILEDIKKDKEKKSEVKEIDYLKKIKRKMNMKSKIILITTILLSILIIFNILIFINYKNYAEKLEIFLYDDITQEQLEDIQETIKEICDEAEVEYHSKLDALEDLKERFGDNAYLLSGYTDENNEFPASYIVKVKLNKVKEIEEKITTMPGVRKITTNVDINPYALFYFSLKYDLQ